MGEILQAFVQQTFMQNALIGGMLASIVCGLIGPLVVVRRIGYIAGGISHTILAGMGISYWLGQDPMIGATVSALLSAIVIGWVSLHWKDKEDTIISALWAGGMATGILFIAKSPGYGVDLLSYLFGNILLIPSDGLWIIGVLGLGMLFLMSVFYQQLLASSFDEEFAKIRGLNVKFYTYLLYCLVALAVVILIQVVGLILVIALLSLPAATIRFFSNSLKTMMILSSLFGALCVIIGLSASYSMNLPAGPIIILLATFGYLITILKTSLK